MQLEEEGRSLKWSKQNGGGQHAIAYDVQSRRQLLDAVQY